MSRQEKSDFRELFQLFKTTHCTRGREMFSARLHISRFLYMKMNLKNINMPFLIKTTQHQFD